MPEDDHEPVADLVVDVVTHRLPRRFGLDPDVQVLYPRMAARPAVWSWCWHGRWHRIAIAGIAE